MHFRIFSPLPGKSIYSIICFIMSSVINRLKNGTIEIKLTIPWSLIDASYNKQVENAVAEAEIPGFRKGKAPKETVIPKLDKSNLMSHALSEVLPQVYSDEVNHHQLKPILYPQIKIDKGKTGEDWEFTAITCEAPEVVIPDYKNEIPKLQPPVGENKLQTIIDYLQKNSQVAVPDLLIEEESNHRLADLAENLTQLGLDMPKYLQTKKMSAETLKAQTAQTAKADLEIELILNKIRENEKLPDRAKTLELLQNLLKT
jgi:FKBP-type peptidyl-prolyl cis-trans isomerase (trigger factor)